MPISKVERCFESTREFVSSKEFIWVIPNFSVGSLPCSIDSPVKIWGNMNIDLKLQCVEDFNENMAQYIVPLFSLKGTNSKFPVRVQISSLRGEARYDEEFNYAPLKVAIGIGNKFIRVLHLDSFLENGSLSLVVKVTIWFPILKRKSFVPRSNEFCRGALTDFIFNVDGQEFAVHKANIAAQSSVLLKMFTSQDFTEGSSNYCTLSDISMDVFQEFLNFIYDGRLVSFDANIVMELLILAEKYAVGALKQICEAWLVCYVTDENAHDLYQYANLYRCDELREIALSTFKRKLVKHNFAIQEKATPGDIEKAFFHFRRLECSLKTYDMEE